MLSFVSRHHQQIQGTLSGFDRLRFVGSLLKLSSVSGLGAFLGVTGVLLKDFGESMLGISRRIKQAGEKLALQTPSGRVHYLPSGAQSKEDFVRGLPAPGQPGPDGLLAVLSCVDPPSAREGASRAGSLRETETGTGGPDQRQHGDRGRAGGTAGDRAGDRPADRRGAALPVGGRPG
jgi:hypothetical protein